MIGRLPGIGKILVLFERRALVALLAIDAVLVAVHVYFELALPDLPRLLNLSADRSISEFFGYVEMAMAAIVLLITFVKFGEPIMLACSAMFTCMMLDDMLRIHERGGDYFAIGLRLEETEWLRGEDKGELLVWAILAALILPALLYGFLKTPRSRWYRGFGLLLLSGLLALFAVVVDMSHAGVCRTGGGFPYCNQLAYVIEDGGEKVTQTLILAHVVFLARDTSAPALFDFAQQLLPARIGALLR